MPAPSTPRVQSRRARLAAAGLCGSCGQNPPATNKRTGAPCSDCRACLDRKDARRAAVVEQETPRPVVRVEPSARPEWAPAWSTMFLS